MKSVALNKFICVNPTTAILYFTEVIDKSTKTECLYKFIKKSSFNGNEKDLKVNIKSTTELINKFDTVEFIPPPMPTHKELLELKVVKITHPHN